MPPEDKVPRLCGHLLRANTLWMAQLIDETGNPAARSFVDIGTNSPAGHARGIGCRGIEYARPA